MSGLNRDDVISAMLATLNKVNDPNPAYSVASLKFRVEHFPDDKIEFNWREFFEFADRIAAAEREKVAQLVEEWITHPHLAFAIRARGQE